MKRQPRMSINRNIYNQKLINAAKFCRKRAMEKKVDETIMKWNESRQFYAKIKKRRQEYRRKVNAYIDREGNLVT